MTLGAVGFGRGFPRSWLIPILAMIMVLGLAVFGRLSRSIVADLLAWWPVWLGLALLAFVLKDRKVGRLRAAGIIPLLAVLAVLLFLWGHVAGWSLMPSASQRLVGPDVGIVSEVSMSAHLDGELIVTACSDFLYQVEPIRRGGVVGIPGAAEQIDGSTISVALDQAEDPGVYTFAGWDLRLSPLPAWNLQLDGALDADLRALNVTRLELDGSGVVSLGGPDGEALVDVSGSIRVVVPSGVGARVIGLASVPASWTLTDEGAEAPAGGAGWVITVDPSASVVVSEG